MRVRPSRSVEVRTLLEAARMRGTFYTCFCPAGELITFPNLDGAAVAIDAQPSDHVAIQSGGKMWCGYEAFVEHIRALAPHLENALFYVGDEEDYIDEFRLLDGELLYRRVHQGGWRPVTEYIQSLDAAEPEPGAAPGTLDG